MLQFLKKLFCTDHDYEITRIRTKGAREGTIMVDLVCKNCGSGIVTFHDLTETERIEFRNPQVEELLIKQGYLVRKKGKILFNPHRQEEVEVEEMVALAIKLKNKNRFDEAQSIYDSILARDPDNELVLINKAVLLRNKQNIGDAIKIYDKLLKKYPKNFGALANKGIALADIMKYKEAIELYDQALEIKPDDEIIKCHKKGFIKVVIL